MSEQTACVRVRFVGLVAAMSLAATSVIAQKPDPAWIPSRTPDGQPDIQGFWSTGANIAGVSLERLKDANYDVPNRILDPPDGKIPYQPWAAAKKHDVYLNHLDPLPQHLDPTSRCMPLST